MLYILGGKVINVLSLFDGLSGGRIALERAGIKVDTYFASEIDKYAIQISKKNYPDIIHLGDITKWREWNIDWSNIDLLIGGSPCQGFSSAGKQAGTKAVLNGVEYIVTDRETYFRLKDAGAEFLSQSHLFWEYVLILDHLKQVNPNIRFLLENVEMKKELLQMINEALGANSIKINSALVSAQNRMRHYWTNWEVLQPEDKHKYLKDVVLNSEIERVFEFDRKNMVGRELQKSFSILSSDHRGLNRNQKQNAVVDMSRLQELIHSEKAIEYMDRAVRDGRTHWDFGHHSDIRNDKSATVVANFFKGVPYNVFKDWNCIRKFHPVECERLQTLPDNYTDGVSDTQRYKMVGNGWTIDVISHIFSFIK